MLFPVDLAPTKSSGPRPARLRRGVITRHALRSSNVVPIYVVDDEEGLTELYTLFLTGRGYAVRAFNHRAEALTALSTDGIRPALLVMDYFGASMPVNQFIRACRVIHPRLRILMASGLSESDARFSGARPDRFIQKPFTAEEFLRSVAAALAGVFPGPSLRPKQQHSNEGRQRNTIPPEDGERMRLDIAEEPLHSDKGNNRGHQEPKQQ
jgi:DNA-binding response OmpR family regulator